MRALLLLLWIAPWAALAQAEDAGVAPGGDAADSAAASLPPSDGGKALAPDASETETDAAPSPEEEPPTTGDPEVDLRLADLEARLAALEAENRRLSSLVVREGGAPASRFDVYGFTDFTVFYVDAFDEASLFAASENPPALYFGHLNLYFDFRPEDAWRVLAELRFTFQPNGQTTSFTSEQLGTQFSRTSTRVGDPVAGSSFFWGGVGIERAHVDWTPSDRFGLRVGVFLTPFGIWNVDHGTPVLIAARPPLAVLSAPFPERQLGVQAFGSLPWGRQALGWTLYVTNGRGPTELQSDVDADKAVGARLSVGRRERDSAWEFGASAYRGTLADAERTLELDPFRFGVRQTISADQTALGVDAHVEWERLQVYFEGFYGLTVFEDGKRTPQPLLNGTQPDAETFGGYVLGAYRLPLEPIDLRPYAAIDVVDVGGGGGTGVFGRLLSAQGGLNWRPTPHTVLKGSYTRLWDIADEEPLGFALGDAHYFDLQLAVAF
jgi:hypothetical protein